MRSKRVYTIIETHCNCCSDIIARPEHVVENYCVGPRCICGKILERTNWIPRMKIRAYDPPSAIEEYRHWKKASRKR